MVVGMLAVVIGAGPLVAQKDKPRAERPVMKYKYISIIKDGKEVPKEELKDVILTVTGEKGVIKKGDKVLSEATAKVDTMKTPWTIDLKVTTGEGKGKTFKGIMDMEDGKLRVCWGKPDGARPKEFSSKKGSGQVLEVLEEVK
jgi:uncharacterized protein (TIGR03067 family)